MPAQSKLSTMSKRQANKRIFWLILAIFLSAALVPVAISAPGDLIIPRKGEDLDTKYTPESIFPHWIHRIRYRCDACHDSLFKMELGATEITMDMMEKGESCSVCHNGAGAFDINFQTCNRCHAQQPAE